MSSFSEKDKCLIAAEISANHAQRLDRAVAMIRKAAACGADAVKFQAYTPDTLTIDSAAKYFMIKHPRWGGQTLYKLYKKAYTPWKWFPRLKKEAEKCGLVFFATAYDRTSVDFLEDIGVPFHKIASFELVDTPLIEYAAGKKKPLILSTGMASLEEIRGAVSAAKRGGAAEIVLLKCVSSYPADPAEMNLRTMADMKKKFGVPVGISDHTIGTGVPVAAVALGAAMIEKHFTLSRSFKTADSFFSSEPEELKTLVSDVRAVEKALGSAKYGAMPSEKSNLMFRRSLFVVEDVKKGDKLDNRNVRSIRPADGLQPKCMPSVLGRRALRDMKAGTPLKKGMFR